MNKHPLLLRALVLALLLALAACVSAPELPTTIASGDEGAVKAEVSRLIAHEMRANDVPGLSIALVDDQRVVWAQGFGFADLARQIPASADTLYRAGSLTKLFTGAAVLQLAGQGDIDIDQPLRHYLPAFTPEGGQAITTRQVLSHHAGLPRDHRMEVLSSGQPAPFESVVGILSRQGLAYAPGQVFSYSNLGFSLLGNLVQARSGQPYAQVLRQSLLQPLGMDTSSVEAGPAPSPAMAQAYAGKLAAREPPLRDVPAGGLNTSVNDMSSFIRMLFAQGRASDGTRVLNEASVAEMLRVQNSASALDFGFEVGLPWMLSTLGSDRIQGAGSVAHHAGATRYFRSQVYVLPQHKLGVVVLANSDTAGGVVDRVALATLKLALQAKSGIAQPRYMRPVWDDAPLPQELLATMPGMYTTQLGAVQVTAEKGRLSAALGGHQLALRRRVDGQLALDYTVLGLLSIDLGAVGDVGLSLREWQGRSLLVASVAGQEMLLGERLPNAPPLSAAWRARLGKLVIRNPDSAIQDGVAPTATLVEAQGWLLLEMPNPAGPKEAPVRVVVEPVSDMRARVLGMLAGAGEGVDVQWLGGREILSYAGYEAYRP